MRAAGTAGLHSSAFSPADAAAESAAYFRSDRVTAGRRAFGPSAADLPPAGLFAGPGLAAGLFPMAFPAAFFATLSAGFSTRFRFALGTGFRKGPPWAASSLAISI